MNSGGKIHFPNLDGLRFLCCFTIMIFHFEQMLTYEFSNYRSAIMPHVNIGMQDVSLFFTLSGFLITYLLLKEKQDAGEIHLKNYYIRRSLRIWPLYFLIVITGFFILPVIGKQFNISYFELNTGHSILNFILCMLFLPPYGITLKAIGATWSVRVEEIFYIVEPLLIKWVKRIVPAFILIIIGTILFRNGYRIFTRELHLYQLRHFMLVISYYRFSCMAIGGIGAYIVMANKKGILKIIYRKDLQWVVYIAVILMLVFRFTVRYINYEFYSLFFCYIIINLATNPVSVLKLESKLSNYLGRISYGMYLYSTILRIFCIMLAEKIFSPEKVTWQFAVFYYFISFASTIAVSAVSYQYFEKPFLKLKNRFEVVKTKA